MEWRVTMHKPLGWWGLGVHWPLEASLAILKSAAVQAQHIVGCEGALHGLSHALHRGTKKQQREIIRLLRELAEHKRGPKVRGYAVSIVTDLRGL